MYTTTLVSIRCYHSQSVLAHSIFSSVVHLNLSRIQEFPFSEKTYLVVTKRILCCKLQLLNDELIGPHLQAFHGLEDRFEVDIIQSFSCSSNKSGEHVDVRSESRSL